MATELEFKKNSFTFIRYIAAFQVLLGHAYTHLGIDSMSNFVRYSFFFEGVPIFFGLSGYLIWNSINKGTDFKTYWKKRVLRIYPELWMSVALSVMMILILFAQNINITELGLFVITQSTILQFWTPDSLRAYGCGTPNGSLWTICVMVQFYLLIYFLYKSYGKSKNKAGWWGIVLLVALIADIFYPRVRMLFPMEVLYKLYGMTVIPYAFLFLVGCLISEYKERSIPFLKKSWWFWGCMNLILLHFRIDISGSYGIIRTMSLILFVIGFAYKFPNISIKKDLSYGIYLYHMIVINVCIELGIRNSLIGLGGIIAVVLLLAFVSSYFDNIVKDKL